MTKTEAERDLRELVRKLEIYRSMLKEAQYNGNSIGIKNAQRWIKAQYVQIRIHCAECGLELPHDVPETD